ncbi:hypothetical protein H1C71_007675 [Ictidomys tridecemlineatus]|nr:hypothetical protein H1C71_007675 [Ictidomys tridecemlineatus]
MRASLCPSKHSEQRATQRPQPREDGRAGINGVGLKYQFSSTSGGQSMSSFLPELPPPGWSPAQALLSWRQRAAALQCQAAVSEQQVVPAAAAAGDLLVDRGRLYRAKLRRLQFLGLTSCLLSHQLCVSGRPLFKGWPVSQ